MKQLWFALTCVVCDSDSPCGGTVCPSVLCLWRAVGRRFNSHFATLEKRSFLQEF